MTKYDFKTLNDKEFEELSCELLNKKLKLDLRLFKKGRDGGIDVRYSTPKNDNSIIVQAKHYIGSGFTQFKHVLKNKEINNLKTLKPKRYIVVTSLELSPKQKAEIKTILSPYIKSLGDIYSQSDLNLILSENSEIEIRHFKLWFSSIAVHNAILNNAIEGRSRFLLERIKTKIPLFVHTDKLYQSFDILNKEKILLISGQPGIGKTTLAEIIIYEKARKGFKIYEVDNIKEAEDVISPNKYEKQLFYYDDFLGKNYTEIVNGTKSESKIISFLERIRHTPNKLLIVTTRTIILNLAVEKFEKLNQSQIAKKQFELKLEDYSEYEKAKILYNHLYFRKVKHSFIKAIVEKKFYRNIISHKSYTPRTIEFITDSNKIKNFTKGEFIQFILNNLNNPSEIWRYSFNNQINYIDQCLLTTLLSFRQELEENKLLLAFNQRLKYEKEVNNQVLNSNQFNSSIRVLLNGFLLSKLYINNNNLQTYDFINPSLGDFLLGLIKESYAERKAIISSAIYTSQLVHFQYGFTLESELQNIIKQKLTNKNLTILINKSVNNKNLYGIVIYMELLIEYCSDIEHDDLLIEYFEKVIQYEDWSDVQNNMEIILQQINEDSQTFKFISNNLVSICDKLLANIEDIESAKLIPALFKLYEQDYTLFVLLRKIELMGVIVKVVNYIQEEELDSIKYNVISMDDIESIYDSISRKESELNNMLLLEKKSNNRYSAEIDYDYWEERIEENKKDQKNNRIKRLDDKAYKAKPIRNETDAIDDLFL